MKKLGKGTINFGKISRQSVNEITGFIDASKGGSVMLSSVV